MLYEKYGIEPHIINKTSGGYHIFFLLEKTPYKNFKDEFKNIYETIRKDISGDESYHWKSGILKVCGSYDYKGKSFIENISNKFHKKYKIIDFYKIIGNQIFEKYEKINFLEEFKKYEKEEIDLKIKKDSYLYKINEIPFSFILEKLKEEKYDIELENNRIKIKGNEGHGEALYHHINNNRIVDYNRYGRQKRNLKSRGSNYGFLYYLFSLKEEKEDEIKKQIRMFFSKNFNINYINPNNNINTN